MKQSKNQPADDPFKRVILHLDLDCFYAQVEHNRLKVPLSIPLAVQQWNGLIAVNYASREFGVKRHTPVAEALLKCPQLRLVHVPTYSVASINTAESNESEDEIVAIPQYRDEMPAYRSDGTRLPPNPPDPASNKACLEPYRQASMAIFRLIRDWCSSFGEGILLEKGGLDEAFIDITEEVEQQLIDEFDQKYTMVKDELEDIGKEELEAEAIENLKMYDLKWIEEGLDFTGLGEKVLTEIESTSSEEENIVSKIRKSLGKLRIWKGCQLAKQIRSRLHSELSFIASIGIASNKMLAKLVSALYKPDQQTRIEPEAVEGFMKTVPFEKIRMMGGKMGKSVLRSENGGGSEYNEGQSDNDDSDMESVDDYSETTTSGTVMASDLWSLSLSELTERVGDRQTASWIHQLIRGLDPSPVTPRSLTKSFMSAKSFRPSVRDWPELHDWVVVLVGELWSRMGEEKENSGRWPITITIHYKSFSKQSSSGVNNKWNNTGAVTKSCEFPYSSSIPSQATRSDFLSSVFKLLNNPSSTNKNLFPMGRLAVSVTNFKALEVDGKARATRLDQFFKKKQIERDDSDSTNSSFDSAGLERFFTEKLPSTSSTSSKAPSVHSAKKSVFELLVDSAAKQRGDPSNVQPPVKKPKTFSKTNGTNGSNGSNGLLEYFKCSVFKCSEMNCKFSCPLEDEKLIQEHSDHHFAIKLSKE